MGVSSDVKSRLGAREELDLRELRRLFGVEQIGTEEQLGRILEVFELEYDVPVGALRPDDLLALFTEPDKTANPIKWMFDQFAYQDRTSELNVHLKKFRRRIQAEPVARSNAPKTLRDFVMAAIGK